MKNSTLKKHMLYATIIFTPFLSIAKEGQDEMKRGEVNVYMQAYDNQFDSNRLAMQENIENGLLTGEFKMTELKVCQKLEEQKYLKLDQLKEDDPYYFTKLGQLDGKWDGRIVGCQDAYAVMNQRLDRYENDIKNRWTEGTSLGEKVAALELELFSNPPNKLEDQCFNAHRVQGVVQFFLSDEVKKGEQLARVQLECQGQANLIVQNYRLRKQRQYIASRDNSGAYRSSASVTE